MASIQLTFASRTSPGAKTVHLIGSWDNYTIQIPMSKDRAPSQAGNWRGTFRFKNGAFQPGKRYWYYYIVDGHQVSYNPKQSFITEPITKQILNILDIPCDGISQNSSPLKTDSLRSLKSDTGRYKPKYVFSPDKKPSIARRGLSRDCPTLTVDIPKGRPLSISKIKSPRPITPNPTKFILEADFSATSIEDMTCLFDATLIENYRSVPSKSSALSVASYSDSDCSSRSDVDSPSSPSSLSDYTPSDLGSQCNCERYEMTRWGDTAKLDCSGSRYGIIDDSSVCYSSEEDNYPSSTQRYHRAVRSLKNNPTEVTIEKERRARK